MPWRDPAIRPAIDEALANPGRFVAEGLAFLFVLAALVAVVLVFGVGLMPRGGH